MNKIFTMKPSEFEISLSVESYDKKTAEKLSGRKVPHFQTIKDINFIFW